jgi:hypothetical protein
VSDDYPHYEGHPVYPSYASGGALVAEPPAGPPPPTVSASVLTDLRGAGVVVAALAVLGALLGVAWSAWAGAQQRAFVIAPGQLYPFDEVETMARTDGRYLVIVAVVGLAAGFATWLRRLVGRGPIAVLALLGGGLLGAALTAWIGHLTGGGTTDGKPGTTIAHLPVSLHMSGLLLVEPALAILVYGLFTAFAVRDDLGRDDPVRERVSVQARQQAQDGRGDRDAAGALKQGDLPA